MTYYARNRARQLELARIYRDWMRCRTCPYKLEDRSGYSILPNPIA